MAQQPDWGNGSQVVPTGLSREMEQSYLAYAMSVIVGRALPDARDGLKPVHRRILYAMHELGLTPDRPFRKCARVVGDVLGKYHPHGDQAVYDALVRMVQDFASRYPLLAGHGNFGSVDDDPPAAMRYTETRLAPLGQQALLDEVSEATVDFVANFDNSQQEPLVLPARLPTMLLNGCAGIAVGMATNVPPHNLGELVDGLIALIDHPRLPDERLWSLIPGPDFPSGGEIVNPAGAIEAYRSGRGTITVRGIAHFERIRPSQKRRQTRTAIVVTELPFQINKAQWIAKVADLVNRGRLEGIADLRDESDRDGMRIAIELKRDADPETVLAELYRQTPLQANFGALFLALADGQPMQLSLRQLLERFLQFREQTLTRQYRHELETAQQRYHITAGLLTALEQLDRVVTALRDAPDGTTASATLQQDLELSEAQADAILAMPLRRLTGLERQKLQAEADELQERIQRLERLLADRRELLKALKQELRALKRHFGDARRTRIASAEAAPALELSAPEPAQAAGNAEPDADAIVTVTYRGRASWSPASAPSPAFEDDVAILRQRLGECRSLLAIADDGKAYGLDVRQLRQQGQSWLEQVPETADAQALVLPLLDPEPSQAPASDLVLLTQQGRIKRLALTTIAGASRQGKGAITLKSGDRLQHACLAQTGLELAVATTGGRLLRLVVGERQLPAMGRLAQGHAVTRLRAGEGLAGCCAFGAGADLLLVSRQGYAKRLPATTARLTERGSMGTPAFQFASDGDALAGMALAPARVALPTDHGRWRQLDSNKLPYSGKDGAGERAVRLRAGEAIAAVVPTAPK
ncbi:MAG: DNA topoisomerase IV [Cyanobacteria bacterium QS_8_64_29]|nr:MAG: DNA topoisomerase IV [Cyanobacteria bacterium QS_8_64_29]